MTERPVTVPARHDGGEHDPLREAIKSALVPLTTPGTWRSPGELTDALLADPTVRDEMARRERDAADERREVIRAVRNDAWREGYEACRRGEQKHSPYRAASLDPTTGKEQP